MIPLLDLTEQHHRLHQPLQQAMLRVLDSGHYILGPEVSAFEQEIAQFLQIRHALGVSSGSDALLVALMALELKPGDEVITTPFSFFATAGCIARVGARPVFVDIELQSYNIDPTQIADAISDRTRAIIPVHLYGQPCDMRAIGEVARTHQLRVVEDAAQAIGAEVAVGAMVGGLGDIGCFSFFPSKNLGCLGDGGLVTTQDPELAERLRSLRAHGAQPKYFHQRIGGNFRLDELQAAVLRVKLPHLAEWTAARRACAKRYDQLFRQADISPEELTLPARIQPGHVYHQYVIRTPRRDDLQQHLQAAGIGTAIYYPKPLHLQECFGYLEYEAGTLPNAELASAQVLALPMYPELSVDHQEQVVAKVADFFRRFC